MALGIALTACAGEPRTPIGILEPPDRPGQSSSASAVIGAWRVVLIIWAAGDLQQWETEWRFGADRRCRFDRTTFSVVEGIRRTVTRFCSYIDRGNALEVRYDETGSTERLPYEFPSFDRNRLILEGVQYERIG